MALSRHRRKLPQLTSFQSTAIKSVKAIAPLLDRILVQRIKAEAKTAGGIFLPESSVKELNEAKVLAVGPGAVDKDGKRITPGIQPGDKVLIPQVRRPCRAWLALDTDAPCSTVVPPSRSTTTTTLFSGSPSMYPPPLSFLRARF